MSEAFIPFGTQYYRAPTPLKKNWEKDLKLIKEYGLNTIKIWAQWRWNWPQKDKFYFDDLDQIMDIADKEGLKVVINVIFDVAPAWFFKKYPDSVMLTCDGRRVEPQATAWRQVGGAPGPCYNQYESGLLKDQFLKAVVNRYKNHPALYMWDLWNEPELTCGILREPLQKNMVCYCDNCIRRFKKWLEDKYTTLEKLNYSWNRNYSSWEEVEVPRTGHTFSDMIDWRMFFSDTLTKELKQRVSVTKEYDPVTPVMIHSETLPEFNMVFSGNNDYDMAELCDVVGSSNGSWPYSSAFYTSCAKGRKVINAEIYLNWGGTYDRPVKIPFEDVKANIFIPAARGVKGFIAWQFRPEALGQEAPAWGMIKKDGAADQLLEEYAAVGRVLQANVDLFDSVSPLPSEVAILNSSKAQVFDWCVAGSVDLYAKSVIGTFNAMYDCNINVDIVNMEKLNAENIRRYKVIYCPFPYYIDSLTASILKKWVADGGCLIAEAFFGAVAADNGLHSETVPGFNFDEVFGVAEGKVSTSSIAAAASDKTTLNGKSLKDNAEDVSDEAAGGPVSAALINNDAFQKMVEIKVIPELRETDIDNVIETASFAEELIPDRAEVLGVFNNGSAAVTINSYGEGKAVMIGSLLGYAYHKTSSRELRKFLYNLVKLGKTSFPVEVQGAKVRIDVLRNKDKDAILVINSFDNKDADIRVNINIDLGEKTRAINLLTEDKIEMIRECSGYTLSTNVGANTHNIYKIV